MLASQLAINLPQRSKKNVIQLRSLLQSRRLLEISCVNAFMRVRRARTAYRRLPRPVDNRADAAATKHWKYTATPRTLSESQVSKTPDSRRILPVLVKATQSDVQVPVAALSSTTDDSFKAQEKKSWKYTGWCCWRLTALKQRGTVGEEQLPGQILYKPGIVSSKSRPKPLREKGCRALVAHIGAYNAVAKVF